MKHLLGILTGIILLLGACGQEQSLLASRSTGTYKTLTKDQVSTHMGPNLSIDALIGQMLLVQLRYTPEGGPKRGLSEADRQMLRNIVPGGVVFFGENMGTIPQVINLVEDISQTIETQGGFSPFIAIDQEGGLVSRLHSSGMIPGTVIPSARDIGKTQNPEAARITGQIIGAELASLGIHMNFAPVADLAPWNRESFIGSRSYGEDPRVVGRFMEAFIAGQTAQGVLSIMKHFPGHGGTNKDSHFQVISFDHLKKELLQGALLPFKQGIDAGAAGIMAAHIAFPNIDPTGMPASISPILLQGLLRDELEFRGLIITDALEMRGISRLFSPEEAAVQAVLAGADCILTTVDPYPIRNALVTAVHEGRISRARIVASVRRILFYKQQVGLLDGVRIPQKTRISIAERIIGSEEHRRLIESIQPRD